MARNLIMYAMQIIYIVMINFPPLNHGCLPFTVIATASVVSLGKCSARDLTLKL